MMYSIPTYRHIFTSGMLTHYVFREGRDSPQRTINHTNAITTQNHQIFPQRFHCKMKFCSLVSYTVNNPKEINEPTQNTEFVTHQQEASL